jgi:UDP-glucose 4-epimerase
MRVVMTGMGGELGSRVTQLLEARADVETLVGIDIDPPRRRLTRADFHRIDPRDRRRIAGVVRDADPTVVVHLGVFEPHARLGPGTARSATSANSLAVLGAASECPSLERVVVRSGIEVYGRRRGAATRPDELVPPQPTSAFGASLLHVEALAASAGAGADVPVTSLRFAPLVGPHFPSPLGRYLRLPMVPVSGLSDLPFALLHQEDAASAIVAAIDHGPDGPVNVVAPGAVTASQAVRLGGRIPLPVVGPGWILARVAAEVFGAPLPDHIQELLTRGRVADGGRAESLLGVSALRSTPEVVKELFDWASVVYLPVIEGRAA